MGGDALLEVAERYGCGPIRFSGTADALYERHLTFDDVVPVADAGPRERFEALARSVRDLLSQRWIHTEQTYTRENPKRVYYLSMEFLLGRSLANNVTNLRIAPHVVRIAEEKQIDWIELLEQEPDAGLGNGGLGRLAACFLDSLATLQIPAMGYGLRYEYGIFRQSIRERLAARAAGPLAAPAGSLGGRASERAGDGGPRLLVRDARRAPGADSGAPVPPDRHSLRPARGRIRRQDDQYAAPVGGGGSERTSTSSASAAASSPRR